MLFSPNVKTFKAAPRLCICNECRNEYGSCSLFEEYLLTVTQLKTTSLSSSIIEEPTTASDEAASFLVTDSICAEAADSLIETVWFIQIVNEEKVSPNDLCYEYGIAIPAGHPYLEGRFLERNGSHRKGHKFKLSNKKTFFYKEIVVYPFANFTIVEDMYLLTNRDYMAFVM